MKHELMISYIMKRTHACTYIYICSIHVHSLQSWCTHCKKVYHLSGCLMLAYCSRGLRINCTTRSPRPLWSTDFVSVSWFGNVYIIMPDKCRFRVLGQTADVLEVKEARGLIQKVATHRPDAAILFIGTASFIPLQSSICFRSYGEARPYLYLILCFLHK